MREPRFKCEVYSTVLSNSCDPDLTRCQVCGRHYCLNHYGRVRVPKTGTALLRYAHLATEFHTTLNVLREGDLCRICQGEIDAAYARLVESGFEVDPTWEQVQQIDSKSPLDKVYFLECGRFIKIGVTRDITDRLRSIATSNPFEVKLICMIPGSYRTEKFLHKKFEAAHHALEWFKATPELLAYIDSLKGAA